ncbi:PREDICTED: E3 ubiquitin-protein ligase SINA-like 2 [Camelina sativa]|uniref:E3 ubiquitin-protein ligase SINA-like 2 n=1 Tax=Camelina sativa TaxID=90675 RepID=A0ABM0Z7G7_CAMSA|nr:PREDICTED: E3 ubiquitin-protein ligase SINA-like 2 [Camelina sativa]
MSESFEISCCDEVMSPIFQCVCGHITCSLCCTTKLRNKCSNCNLPIGRNRSGNVERIMEGNSFLCQNTQHGCTMKFNDYKELSVHEKECCFALCYCPAPYCYYRGVYNDLNSHYSDYHRHDEPKQFWCTNSICAWRYFAVIQRHIDGPLVAVIYFKAKEGLYLTVNCIAPSAPGVGELTYEISCSMEGNTMTFGSSEMNRVQKLSFKTPEKDFMLVPNFLWVECPTSNMVIRIREKDEEDVDDEVIITYKP